MKALNDQLKYTAIDCKLSAENAVENFKNYDLIVDATDNFNARYVRDDVKLLSWYWYRNEYFIIYYISVFNHKCLING